MGLGLLILGALALYMYEQQNAQASIPSTPDNTSPSPLPDFSSLFSSLAPTDTTASYNATSDPTASSFADLSAFFGSSNPTVAPTDQTTATAAPATSSIDWLTGMLSATGADLTPASVPAVTQSAPSGTDYSSFFSNPLAASASTSITNPDQINMTASWKTGVYPQYAVLIANVENQYGIPTDLLARLLYQESSYNPAIVNGTQRSSVGAIGIAQFMPATAAQFGIDPSDPTQAIPAAGKYLSQLYNEFGDWQLALMAYNWGPGNVSNYVASGESNTVPTETQNYVADITGDVPVA